jgi:ribosomal protein S15P/S13E
MALCLTNTGDASTVRRTARIYREHCDTKCVDLNSQRSMNKKESHMRIILQYIETSFVERHTVEPGGRRGVKKPHT